MKLNSFKFQDGKVFWLPEYPEKTISYCSGKPYCCEGRRCDVLQHDDAVAKSLASAIEVAPEDRESIRLKVWSKYPDAVLLETGKVYSAECEMEIEKKKQQHLCKACKVDCIAALGKGTCKAPLIKVGRLKPTKKENSAHSFTEGMEVDAVLKPEGKEEKEVELREFIKNRFRQIEVILSGPGSAEWYPFDGFDREGVIAMKRAYQDIFGQLIPSSKKQ